MPIIIILSGADTWSAESVVKEATVGKRLVEEKEALNDWRKSHGGHESTLTCTY